MRLARAIANLREPDAAILPTGFSLDTATIARLHELGVYDLWINDPALDFLDDLYSPNLTCQQQRLCDSLKESFNTQTQRGAAMLQSHHFRPAAEELVHAILAAAANVPFLSMLALTDDALLRHSTDVCVLGLMLGLRLGSYLAGERKYAANNGRRDLINLGLGCLLHDIGELERPPAQRESRQPLAFDPDAAPDWRQHTSLGYNGVRGQFEPSAATIVLHHHQHFDGSGFSGGGPGDGGDKSQCGSQIHIFSRIAMAADTFEHLLHKPGVAQPPVCALSQIQQNPVRRWFDPVVLSALQAVVLPFVPGMVVTLSDRRHAVVTRIHDAAPCYPEVRILANLELGGSDCAGEERETVDLATSPNVFIRMVDGFDVAASLYGARHSEPLAKSVRQERVPAMA